MSTSINEAYPHIFTIISPPRSGSTALLNALTQPPSLKEPGNVLGISEPLNAEIRIQNSEQPTYDIYRSFSDPKLHPFIQSNQKKKFIVKHVTSNSCQKFNFQFFPDNSILKRSHVLFLFRDPINTWISQKTAPFNFFIDSYKKAYDQYKQLSAQFQNVHCITYERLVSQPQKTLRSLCEKWGISYSTSMVNWLLPFNINIKKNIYFEPNQMEAVIKNRDLHKTVINSRSFSKLQSENRKNITADEKSVIEKELRPIYAKIKNQSDIDFPTTE